MKQILTIVITIILSVQLFAQELPILSDSLLRAPANKGYEYYVGTWKWEDTTTNSEFFVKLELSTWTSRISSKVHTYLKGAYLYKKDGIILVNYLEELNENRSIAQYSICITADIDNNMQLRARDYLLKNGYGEFKYHGGSSSLEYVSSNPERIRWRIVDDASSGHVYVDEKMIFPPGISLPSDIILTKVED